MRYRYKRFGQCNCDGTVRKSLAQHGPNFECILTSKVEGMGLRNVQAILDKSGVLDNPDQRIELDE